MAVVANVMRPIRRTNDTPLFFFAAVKTGQFNGKGKIFKRMPAY